MSHMVSGYNEFKMVPYFFLVPSAPAGDIFGRTNNEMTDKITRHIHLYKESEEEQVGGKFREEKNFTRGKRKIWQEQF